MTLFCISAALAYGLACFALGLYVARFLRHGTRAVYDAEFHEIDPRERVDFFV